MTDADRLKQAGGIIDSHIQRREAAINEKQHTASTLHMLSELRDIGFSSIDDYMIAAKLNLLALLSDAPIDFVYAGHFLREDGLKKIGIDGINTIYIIEPPDTISLPPKYDISKIDVDYCALSGIRIARSWWDNILLFGAGVLRIQCFFRLFPIPIQFLPGDFMLPLGCKVAEELGLAVTQRNNDLLVGDKKLFGCSHLYSEGTTNFGCFISYAFDKTKFRRAFKNTGDFDSISRKISVIDSKLTDQTVIDAVKTAIKIILGKDIP